MMDNLDDLFASAKAYGRSAAVEPSDALMARVLADAAELQPKPGVVARVAPAVGFWAGMAALFGGGGVLAGVGSAAVAGLFVGFVQPAGLSSVTDLLSGGVVAQVELMPGVDALLAEE